MHTCISIKALLHVHMQLHAIEPSERVCIATVSEISKRHRERWIEDFKFVGDNVAKTKVVRDIRSDHHSHLVQYLE